MYWWQVGRFFRDAEIRNQFVPLLYRQFDTIPTARTAFFAVNEDLLRAVRSGTKTIPRLNELKRPVRIIFGASGPYLNKGVAQRFHELFPTSDLFLFARCSTLCTDGRATGGGAPGSVHASQWEMTQDFKTVDSLEEINRP